MAVTVHYNWGIDVKHTLVEGKQMYIKFVEMQKANKVIDLTDDEFGSPTYTFVDQAAADEFISFMSQFNPESVDVKTV